MGWGIKRMQSCRGRADIGEEGLFGFASAGSREPLEIFEERGDTDLHFRKITLEIEWRMN